MESAEPQLTPKQQYHKEYYQQNKEKVKKQNNEYKKNNIGLLSYFIHDTWDKTQKAEGTFKAMYGKSAKYINIDDMSLVANTINKLLLSNTIKVY